jgi:hypothetical protein
MVAEVGGTVCTVWVEVGCVSPDNGWFPQATNS